MTSPIVLKVVSAVVTVVFSFAAVASDSAGAIVLPEKTVSINGNAVNGSHALFKGDLIQTNDRGATIASTGSVFAVGPFSSLEWGIDATVIRSGGISVKTTKQFSSSIFNLKVRPQKPNAAGEYVVAVENERVTIGAKVGALNVTDGNATITIPEGRALVAPVVPLPSTEDQQGTVKAPANVGVALAHADIVAITVLAAGGGAALVYLLTNRAPSSPSS